MQNFTLKFPAVAEKTANNLADYFFAAPGMRVCPREPTSMTLALSPVAVFRG